MKTKYEIGQRVIILKKSMGMSLDVCPVYKDFLNGEKVFIKSIVNTTPYFYKLISETNYFFGHYFLESDIAPWYETFIEVDV